MTNIEANDYEIRDVNYDIIHGETIENFKSLINILNIQPGEKMLDLGGGYGSVLEKIVQVKDVFPFHYDLLDGGQHQLNKGKQRHQKLLQTGRPGPEIRYLHQNAVELNLSANYYDVVLCKMFIHEIPEINKQKVFDNIYSVIKPGGRVVIWAPDLNNEDKDFYSKVIFQKDKLAGFESLLKNRHFSLSSEICTYLNNSGFKNAEKLHAFFYDLHTVNRLKEEFANDESKLLMWNDYILKLSKELSEENRKKMLISIQNTNIHLRFNRAIFKAVK